MSKLTDYPFEVRPLTEEEGGGYLVSFPDFAECISDGETVEEAIENGQDALKAVAAGANVAMMTSEILHNGIGRFGEILREMSLWLEEREYQSLNELHGSLSQINVAAPAAFERANYIQIVRSYSPTFR